MLITSDNIKYTILPDDQLDTIEYDKDKVIDKFKSLIDSLTYAKEVLSKLEDDAPYLYQDLCDYDYTHAITISNLADLVSISKHYMNHLQQRNDTIPPREQRLTLEFLGFTKSPSFRNYYEKIIKECSMDEGDTTEIKEELFINSPCLDKKYVYQRCTIHWIGTSSGRVASRENIIYEELPITDELLIAINNTINSNGGKT